MIGNSLSEYLFIRTSITTLRLVAPASILYLAVSAWNAAFPVSPLLGVVALAEAGFFLGFYLPRKIRLQAVRVVHLWDSIRRITVPTASTTTTTSIDETTTSIFLREMLLRPGTHPSPVQFTVLEWMVFTSRSGISA
jgi:hypothetical protein